MNLYFKSTDTGTILTDVVPKPTDPNGGSAVPPNQVGRLPLIIFLQKEVKRL